MRHDQGMPTARRLSWDSPWVLAGLLFANVLISLNGVRRGDVSESMLGVGAAVLFAWLLIRRRRLKRHPQSWDQATTSTFRFFAGSSIVCLGFAVLLTILAIQAEGGRRIFLVIGVGVLSVCGAIPALYAVATHRLRSGRPLGRLAWLMRRAWERGCAICGDNAKMYSGQLELARDEARAVALVRCPRCGWLYVLPTQGPREAVRVNEFQAGVWFPAEYS